jgi:hypothetical protein
MPRSLHILSCASSGGTDRALGKLVSFLGVRTKQLSLPAQVSDSEAIKSFIAQEETLALSRDTLQILLPFSWFTDLLRTRKFIFLYGFEGAASECEELKWLTRGAIAGCQPVGSQSKSYQVHCSETFREFPVAGRGYTLETPDVDCAFHLNPACNGVEQCISLNGRPKFVRVEFGNCNVFLLADRQLVDIEVPLGPQSLRPWYAKLLSIGVFVRHVFGGECWTSPGLGATVTIDDPMLTHRYGFLHYDSLLRELQTADYSLTVAFIPYNYRRSDSDVTSLLRRHASRFSIAVHGFDHTRREFASTDARLLYEKAWSALERMETHSRLNGMPFDDVMVFPQAKFSREAITALKACRYLAAANSTPWPVNPGDQTLTIRDLLDVAVLKYDSFPVFARRYPTELFDFAFDAFFNKPLLLIEHHELFRDGFGTLRNAVRELQSFKNVRLRWQPLREAVISSYVTREIGPGHREVRFFTPVLRLRNDSPQRCLYTLIKEETSRSVEGMFRQGEGIPYENGSGSLCCQTELEPGEESELRIAYKAPEKAVFVPSLKYRWQTFTRRRMCEMRDNFVSKSPRLLTVARRAKALVSGRSLSKV